MLGAYTTKRGPIRLMVPGVIVVSAVLWAMTLLGTTTWVGYILAGHVVMSVGFAFLFTPLFTASLSSVKPSLYSHGSAVIGTIQQVAGAAGVALFVALMSARAANADRAGTAIGRCPVGRHPRRLSLRRHHFAFRRGLRFFRAEAARRCAGGRPLMPIVPRRLVRSSSAAASDNGPSRLGHPQLVAC